MKTPLLMVLILTLPWLVVLAIPRLQRNRVARRIAATLGLALLFGFTASGHFIQTEAMAQMLPPWVPARITLVQVTGVLEILVAVGLLWSRTRRAAAWAAVTMLVVFFPCNVYAAINHVPMGGHAWGPVYLLIRAPLQLLIIAWTWMFVLRSTAGPGDDAVQPHGGHAEMPR